MSAENQTQSSPTSDLAVGSSAWLGCPFCGEHPIIHHFTDDTYMLRCESPVCPIHPQTMKCSVAGCAEHWNMRWPTPEAALAERLGNALREQNERWGLYGDESQQALKDFEQRKASVGPPNDPSSATRPTRGYDCNHTVMAGFAAARGCVKSRSCFE